MKVQAPHLVEKHGTVVSLPIHTRLTFLDKGKNKNDLLLQVFPSWRGLFQSLKNWRLS